MTTPRSRSQSRESGGPVDLVVLITPEQRADEEYNELRFVLRSFEVNFPRRGRVFIVGEGLPAWVDRRQVVHMPIPDLPVWKDFNIIHKLRMACHAGVTRQFLFCSDDQFLLRPSVPADFHPRADGRISAWSEETWQKKMAAFPGWFQRLRQTLNVLAASGRRDIFHFDTHHPVLMDATLFPAVVARFGLEQPGPGDAAGVTVNSLYFNAIGASPLAAPDRHKGDGPPPAHARFWNVNSHKDWPNAHAFLQTLFPEPSRFELPLPAPELPGEVLERAVELLQRLVAVIGGEPQT